jgi:signal transduction histidine kinase
VRRADGTELEIQVHGRRLTVGELTGELAILQLRDVTEARKLARRQRLLEEQLEQARKLEAIGTLAGGIAHEFNNRLTAILGFLQLAGLELDASLGAQALLREASKSCRSAATLVQRMLDFSRQSAGPRSPQALAALLERALPAWAGEVPTGVTVELTAERDCPPVWCHPESLLEAVRQLVRNAGWAMKQRGGVVRVAVRSGRAEPALRSRHPDLTDDHAVSVEVGDTGPGMTPEEVRRAFEPFYTTREPGSGEGLGLPVVYAIMKRHRGVVTIDSTPGVGTRVRLFLGVRPDGPAPGAKAAGGQSGHAGG